MKNKRNRIKTFLVSILTISLIFPFPTSVQAESSDWSYQVSGFTDLEDGTFEDIIWDDENRRIQLQGKTLEEDFTMYDDIDDMQSQGWKFSSSLNEPSSVAKITQYNGSKQLYLERKDYYTNNLVLNRAFSPTKRGEVEFDITPVSGKTRVALNHYPTITLEKGQESSQFMFRFEQNDDGNNVIRFGTNRGGGIKGEEYDIINNAFVPGKTYRVKMVWDLNNANGVSVYLDGKKVVSNFYQSMVTDDFYFYGVSLTAGEGGSPLKGTPGRAYYDFVSLEQSFNLAGTYSSQEIEVNVSDEPMLSRDATITWDEDIVNGTVLSVQTNVSKDNGKTWGGWKTVQNGDSIPGLSKFDTVSDSTHIQYRVSMTANQNDITPWIKNIALSMGFDRELPNLEVVSSNTEWTNQPIELSVTATDNLGVDHIILPNGVIVNGNQAVYKVSSSGTYTFTVYDLGGNKRNLKFVVGNVDTDDPILQITPKRNTGQQIDLRLEYSD